MAQMEHQLLRGNWAVSKFELGRDVDTAGLDGVKFRMDAHGNVEWCVGDDLINVPLFCCDTYKLHVTKHKYFGFCFIGIQFGGFSGHIIDMKVKTFNEVWNEYKEELRTETFLQDMLLENELYQIYCIRIADTSDMNVLHYRFSLLPALEDGFFADMPIAVGGRQYEAHATILRLLAGDGAAALDWWQRVAAEPVAAAVLHYLYAEALPPTMDDSTAEQVIQAVSTYECLNKLSDMCQTFITNNALKKQMIDLVNDIHASINKVIEHFVNFNTSSAAAAAEAVGNDEEAPSGWARSSPGHLCYIIKQAFRDCAVVCIKIILLCDLFHRSKDRLSCAQRNDVITYVHARVPLLIMQSLKFFRAIKRTLSSMSSAQRQEVATFLVPEVESIFDTLADLVLETNKAMLKVIELLSPRQIKQKGVAGETLCRRMYSEFFHNEVLKYRTAQEIIVGTLEALMSKKENFGEMTQTQKVRTVTRNFDQLIEELTVFLGHLEELPATLDDRLESSEFKFCFKVGVSNIAGILDTLVDHRGVIQALLLHCCELVQRDSFLRALQKLELLEEHVGVPARQSSDEDAWLDATPSDRKSLKPYLNNLYAPLSAARSLLAQKCLELFRSERGTDMVFEVLSPKNPDEDASTAATAAENVEESSTLIKAHRVIVAARCDWFRRALQSGMRESIDRRIVIHDTSPLLFRIFLEYLYSGQIDPSLALSNEQYVELLLLSDRYEVDALKHICEYALQAAIDSDTALYYLGMADQFNARILRSMCIMYIWQQDPDLLRSDYFFELPVTVQSDVYNSVWSEASTSKFSLQVAALKKFPKDAGEVPRRTPPKDVNEWLRDEPVDETSREDQRLRLRISQMKDIVGEDAPHEALVQVILAADYDLCRAINYFYANSSNDENE